MARSGVFDLLSLGHGLGPLYRKIRLFPGCVVVCVSVGPVRYVAGSLFTCEPAPFLLFVSHPHSSPAPESPSPYTPGFPSLAGHDPTCVSILHVGLLALYLSTQ